MPIPNRGLLRSALLAALFFFLSSGAVQGHRASGPNPAQAPAADAPLESLVGTVRELVVENRVSNVTAREVGLRLDDGNVVALRGTGLEALSEGLRVQASGRMSGADTLFVGELRVLATGKSEISRAQATWQVEGTLALMHADDFANSRGSYAYVVRGDDGQTTPLQLPALSDALQRGMRVIASGVSASDGFSLDASYITVLALPADPLPAPTTNNVLVVLIKFTDSPAPAFTSAQVDAVFRTSSTSVTNYFNEVSYGQHLLNVTVTNWLTASTATPANCNFIAVGQAADAAASAAGYNGTYQNRYYVMPYNGSCGWAGLAYIGSPYLAWSNGYNQLGVYGHELGHNFGLLHAASLYCAGQVLGGSCSASEYGDPFDIMGNINAMHFNAAQKSLLNWIPATTVKTHSGGTATYTLSPIESAGATTYAVKVPTTANRTYWIEYRQPIGFDAGMSSYPNNGAQVRVASPFESLCGGCADDTEILDMTPGTANSFGDAALLAGNSYTDATNNITVSVLSASAAALSVQISAAGASPTTTSVTSSLNPATVGASITFTSTVTGSNPGGSVNFKDGGVSIGGCSASPLAGAGNTRTAVCTTGSIPWGSRSIVASYSGDAANIASTSAGYSQTVYLAGANVALASTGAVASASSTYSYSLRVTAINDNERAGANWGNGGGWADATPNAFPDWVQINFNGSKTIDHVVVYTVQDSYANPIEPTDTQAFSLYGVTDFSVQAWNGNAWVTLGSVSGNNLVKRSVFFSPYTTDRIRISISGALASSSRITEVEAWGLSAGSFNVALSGLGAVASASSTLSAAHPVAAINNNDRTGINWGNGGGWADGTPNGYPDWVQINFAGSKTIDRVVVYSVQDNFANPVEPTDTQTFSLFGVTDFSVQGWNGSAWVTLGSASGNNLVKRTVSFGAYSTDRIRINVTGALASSSRITEVEAWGN